MNDRSKLDISQDSKHAIVTSKNTTWLDSDIQEHKSYCGGLTPEDTGRGI